jgi:hypothetical protein
MQQVVISFKRTGSQLHFHRSRGLPQEIDDLISPFATTDQVHAVLHSKGYRRVDRPAGSNGSYTVTYQK